MLLMENQSSTNSAETAVADIVVQEPILYPIMSIEQIPQAFCNFSVGSCAYTTNSSTSTGSLHSTQTSSQFRPSNKTVFSIRFKSSSNSLVPYHSLIQLWYRKGRFFVISHLLLSSPTSDTKPKNGHGQVC
jgi:hypothetical protein